MIRIISNSNNYDTCIRVKQGDIRDAYSWLNADYDDDYDHGDGDNNDGDNDNDDDNNNGDVEECDDDDDIHDACSWLNVEKYLHLKFIFELYVYGYMHINMYRNNRIHYFRFLYGF
jgi:hypothetical protein